MSRLITRSARHTLVVLGPVVVAFGLGAAILALLGRNPSTFYSDLFRSGLISQAGWQAMLTRLAPLLLIGTGYILAFRAGIWNIGGDGQFLLACAVVAGLGPQVMGSTPRWVGLILLCVAGLAVGGAWTLVPAYLRAWHGVNEVVSSVMMSFIGVNLANLLIKQVWRSKTTIVPQTEHVPLAELLPRLGGSTVHAGILVGVAAVAVTWYLTHSTTLGLKLSVMGASQRVAAHVGLPVKRLIMGTFFASGALVGLAGAVEILGQWGYMRADWNPQFGLPLFALVFLARLNPLAVVPLACFYAVLEIGGHEAARRAALDHDFILVLVGLVLILMATSQYLALSSRERATVGRKAAELLHWRRET
ncbi:MAG: ABC transporter permease [Thermoleophilia bacterium]|nr:ABC transporter permease [Thermoleophilia bacterium]